MRLEEHVKPKFDPRVRLTDMRVLHVAFTPEQWMQMEIQLGRYINAAEIQELILGCFLGTHKIVKR